MTVQADFWPDWPNENPALWELRAGSSLGDGPWSVAQHLNTGASVEFPIRVWRQNVANQPWWGFPAPDPPAVLFWGWWSGDYWSVGPPSGNQVF